MFLVDGSGGIGMAALSSSSVKLVVETVAAAAYFGGGWEWPDRPPYRSWLARQAGKAVRDVTGLRHYFHHNAGTAVAGISPYRFGP